MSYKSFYEDNIALVEWIDPSPKDLDEILSNTVAAKARCGRGMTCITVLKNSTEFPSAPARNRMAKRLPVLLKEAASSIHFVQHGINVRTARLTSFAIELLDQVGTKAYLNNSIRQALESAPVKPSIPIDDVLDRMRAEGFDVD